MWNVFATYFVTTLQIVQRILQKIGQHHQGSKPIVQIFHISHNCGFRARSCATEEESGLKEERYDPDAPSRTHLTRNHLSNISSTPSQRSRLWRLESRPLQRRKVKALKNVLAFKSRVFDKVTSKFLIAAAAETQPIRLRTRPQAASRSNVTLQDVRPSHSPGGATKSHSLW